MRTALTQSGKEQMVTRWARAAAIADEKPQMGVEVCFGAVGRVG